ncbi:hypothetical protein EDC35_103438 [Thiobaca trueperi]|uniref:Uncharacterized protein n=2 Tax=Thiobaca trueperi TaxID=127458 RepID=A0A4R3N680_9GAMM|nr:hypothetical protein EDC35_103438 [Thiobaca trueperi]
MLGKTADTLGPSSDPVMLRSMSNLREKLAEYGFESNDDYDFPLRCLLDSPTRGIRTLNIEGDGERRKTAFAHALAQALEFPHILYHDFTDEHPPLPDVILPSGCDEMGREEPPIDPLDRIVSEACAQSEGEPTALILDQLHAADFREHMRIQRLITHRIWNVRDGRYVANPRHLILFLIAGDPLYHALQKESFRIWIGRSSERQIIWRPDDFALDSHAEPLFDALGELFRTLGSAPTRSEFAHILYDLQRHVRTVEHLQLSLYGRIEVIDRRALADPARGEQLTRIIEASQTLLLAEHIELSGS